MLVPGIENPLKTAGIKRGHSEGQVWEPARGCSWLPRDGDITLSQEGVQLELGLSSHSLHTELE